MNYISTRGLFKKAWATVKAHFGKIVGAATIIFLVQILLDAQTYMDDTSPMTVGMGIFAIIGSIISLIIGVAVTSALIRIGRGAPVNTQVFAITSSQVLRYVGVVVLIGLIMIGFVIPVVGIGFALGVTSFVGNMSGPIMVVAALLFAAVIVLVYINIRLMFASYFVVDGKTGVIDAIKQSWYITKGEVWTIVKLGILSLGVGLLGLLALGVGILVAIPVIAFAYVYLYIELTDRKGKVHQSTDTKVNE